MNEVYCEIDGENVVFGEGHFQIGLSSCASYPAILGWVVFLSEQTWVSRGHLGHFVELATSHHKLKVSKKARTYAQK